MSSISTHVLDLRSGRPAADVRVRLEQQRAHQSFVELAARTTDADGRITDLLDGAPLEAAVYRLSFDTGGYYRQLGVDAFYPEVSVLFAVTDPGCHHHVPLLLSPFGYSTYRGS